MIRSRINSFAEVEKEINRLIALVPEAMATEAKQIIRDNSAAGVDIKGQKMIPYTAAYKKWRANHGLSSEPVTLSSTGHLLDNLKTETQGMKSSVRPSAVDTIIAEGNMRTRKFFPEIDSDLMPEFNNRIVKAGEKAITDASK